MRVVALPVLLCLAVLPVAARPEVLVGVTMNSGLNGINIDVAGDFGDAWILLGAYQAATGFELESLTAVAGYRSYLTGKYNESGFFAGVFAGDVDGGPTYNRVGAGGEIGYQWITSNLRMTLHSGVAIAGEATGGNVITSTDPQPVAIIGASASLRLGR